MRRPLATTAGWLWETPLSRWQGASTRQSFLVLSALAATLLAAQGIVLFPLAIADPQMLDLPDGVALQRTYWIVRALTIAMAPVILGLRVVSVSLLLHGVLALLNTDSRWCQVVRGVLRAEGIFLVESACATIVLLWHAPTTLPAAESLALRAGLDLLWQPTSASLASLLVAANLFALLWTLQIRTVVQQAGHLSNASVNLLAIFFGVLLVAIRTIAVRL